MASAKQTRGRSGLVRATRGQWGDLALVLLGEALLLLLVGLAPSAWYLQAPRVLLGLVWTLYVPGYVLVALLFPRADDLDGPERAALSFALSWAVIPPLALLLDKLPWGLRLWPMVLSLAVFTVAGAAGAGLRRARLPREERAAGAARNSLNAWWAARSGKARLGVCALAIGFVALTTSALVFAVFPGQEDRATAFYLLGPQGLAEDYPRTARVGQPVTVTVGIANDEASQTAFRVEAREDGRPIGEAGPIAVEPGAVAERPFRFTPASADPDDEVTFTLYRGQETIPYRTLRLWLDVER
ncbi:MAG TPA: DUF1616 domain-containing protein [Chloroflexota bacterium]|nr:DUF1616 domain-containing protein [Chloroflexota bacterium]